jgi:hypothetical protein
MISRLSPRRLPEWRINSDEPRAGFDIDQSACGQVTHPPSLPQDTGVIAGLAQGLTITKPGHAMIL